MRVPRLDRQVSSGLLAATIVLALLPAAGGVSAQTTPAQPSGAATQQPATRILAIGRLTAKATPAELPAVLEREVPATLALYLAGKIDAWYARSDQTGVVFLLNVATADEARALLEPLPLGQAGMMTFDLTPVGPLRPLGLLLRPAH